MNLPFVIDKTPSSSTAMDVPAFPWVRTDAGRFVWEEALFEGNLLSIHHSALGRCQSKENVYTKLTRRRFPAQHLYAFELEVDGQLLRDHWTWQGERITTTPEGFNEMAVELGCAPLPVRARIHTLVDGTPLIGLCF